MSRAAPRASAGGRVAPELPQSQASYSEIRGGYHYPEVDKIWVYREFTSVLSKIIFYLLQDGCALN